MSPATHCQLVNAVTELLELLQGRAKDCIIMLSDELAVQWLAGNPSPCCNLNAA